MNEAACMNDESESGESHHSWWSKRRLPHFNPTRRTISRNISYISASGL